jgi:hypothetical protein
MQLRGLRQKKVPISLSDSFVIQDYHIVFIIIHFHVRRYYPPLCYQWFMFRKEVTTMHQNRSSHRIEKFSIE